MPSESREGSSRPVYFRYAFALGVLTSLLTMLLIFTFSDKTFLESFFRDPADFIPAAGTLFVAVLSLFLTFSALEEQRRARQASTDPVILVHFGQRVDAPAMITLEVSNVGAGAAQDVKFLLDPERVGYLITQKVIITDFRKTSHPIRVIPQDRSVSYNFGLGFKLTNEPFIEPIRVYISYADIDGGQYTSIQWLDVRELMWQRADKGVDARAADGIEKLAKGMEKLTRADRRQHVIVQTYSAWRREKDELLASLRKMNEKPPTGT